jgi:hypothetical protein
MARHRGTTTVRSTPALIAVEGVNAAALLASAREALAGVERKRRSGVSHWDASGIFGDLAAAERSAGRPSARTMLLLYAADLAFRVRWEIRPLLDDGKTVVAAPYVATAIAFGRAAGISARWLEDLFSFAPAPGESLLAESTARVGRSSRGFVEFSCELMSGSPNGFSRVELAETTAAYLRTALGRRARAVNA